MLTHLTGFPITMPTGCIGRISPVPVMQKKEGHRRMRPHGFSLPKAAPRTGSDVRLQVKSF
jgi:hypothetical protein